MAASIDLEQVSRLFGDLRVTDDITKALHCADYDFYLWRGFTPRIVDGSYDGVVPGKFWGPNLVATGALASAIRDLMAARGITRTDAIRRMQTHHTGLKKEHVTLGVLAFVEIDHVGKAQQIKAYEDLTAATGLRWCMWVSSGGKSVHAYLRFSAPIDPHGELWSEIQRLLIVVLQGDTQITNPSRLMREPGYVGSERPQPVLRLDPDACYEADDIRDRLQAHARSMGIADVEVAFRALRLAERLEQMSSPDKVDEGKIGTEEAEELRLLAQDLRCHRGQPRAVDVRAARFALSGSPQAPQVSLTARRAVDGPMDRICLTREQADTYRTLAPRSVVPAPCCADHPVPKGFLFEPRGGLVRGYCNRHSTYFYEGESEQVDLSGIEVIQPRTVTMTGEELEAWLDSILGPDSDEPMSEEDPGRPIWMRDTGDPLADEARRVERRLEFRLHRPPARAEAEALQEALDGIIEGKDVGNGGIRHGEYLGELPDIRREVSEETKRSTLVIPTDEEVDEAILKYANLGGKPISCLRGHGVTMANGGPSALTIRVPCGRNSCTVCAPRINLASQAAASVILRTEGFEAGWETVVFETSASRKRWEAIRGQLSRWASLRDRHHLVYGIRPGLNRIHLIYREGDEPMGPSALRRTLVRSGATYESDVVASVMDTISRIDTVAWSHHPGRKCIDRGRSVLQGRITDLRRQVFGNAGSKLTAAERRARRSTRVVFRHRDTTSDIRRDAERVMGGVATDADDVAQDHQTRRAYQVWSFVDTEIDARVALRRIKEDRAAWAQSHGGSAPSGSADVPEGNGFVDFDLGVLSTGSGNG